MKEIIIFYKKNKAISNLGIIMLIISFSYAITYNMPDILGIEAYYSLLNNICISYVAALIFYVFQVYIPEKRNNNKFMEIMTNKFFDFIKLNEIILLLCDKHIIINEKGAIISWNGDGEKIYLKVKTSTDPKSSELIYYTKQQLLDMKKEYSRKLNEIKESTLINYCDSEILEKLSEIEKQDFYTTFANIIRFANSDIGFRDARDSINYFKKLNEELKQLCSVSTIRYLEEVSKEDIQQTDAIYNCLRSNTLKINVYNREVLKANIKEQAKDQGFELSDQTIEMMCDTVMNQH